MSDLVTSFTFSCILGPKFSQFISGHRFQKGFYTRFEISFPTVYNVKIYENLQILTLRQFSRFRLQITHNPPGPEKKFSVLILSIPTFILS